MLFSEAVTRVADDCKIDSTRTTVSARIKREINRVSQQIWDGFHWSFRSRSYRIVTETDEETGTVTATNGSRTITGSGTAFADKHKTWYIYFPQDSILNWYKVKSVASGTSLELDVPYQGTTGSSKTYVIRKFDYVLPTEIYDFWSVTATQDNNPLSILYNRAIELMSPTPLYRGYPEALAIFESDSVPTTYTTGDVTGTIDTTTLTGNGTAWLDNVYPGDSVKIGDYTYTVRQVESDTEITLYNKLAVAASSASYTVTRQFGRIVRVMWPSTDVYTLEIQGYRKYHDLVNDEDTNELLYRIPNVIINKTAAMELKSQDDRRRQELESEARLDLAEAKAEDETLTPKESIATMHSYRSRNRSRIVY